jgi:spoIIIJ-associated protein
MSGFFSRIFGGGKKKEGSVSEADQLVEETLQGIIERGGFELDFTVSVSDQSAEERSLTIEFTGPDSELLKEKEGQMIDSIQLFLKRVLQHRFPEDRTNINIDCEGFREESNLALIDLAEKLKAVALERKKAVYMRALPPKDRKVIHQHLAGDDRVKSRSIGDGLFKKIKIFPMKEGAGQGVDDQSADVE